MPDQFSTNYLIGVIEGVTPPPQGLLDRYFPMVITEESEEIHFDKSYRHRLMAPFVSPLVEGAIMEERGFATETFKPAYLKPKTPLDPTRSIKRVPGEPIGGALSPEDRQLQRIALVLEDHRNYIERRLEWMAAQVLINGSVTVSGDKYTTVTVDFNRDAALDVTLAGNDVWSDETNADPVSDLHDWNELAMQKKNGAPLFDFVMDVDAFKNFRKHPKVETRLDLRRERGSEIEVMPARAEGLRFMGVIDSFNIWVYQAWYEASIGTLTPFLASGTVIGANPDPTTGIAGVQHFGAILDEEALFAARYWPKSWVENDPGRRIVMTQSAPLVVPGRPNATLKASVL